MSAIAINLARTIQCARLALMELDQNYVYSTIHL